MLIWLLGALAALSLPLLPGAAFAEDAAFSRLRAEIRPAALARGVTEATLASTFAGLSPDPEVRALLKRQPESNVTAGRYVSARTGAGTVAAGRRQAESWASVLRATERQTGVPAAIAVAVWGLESGYGAATGRKDAIRSLATLAAYGDRPDFYRAELVEALAILQSGAAARERLQGSWAGAMGQTQFMPTSYTRFGADGDWDGQVDIWTSVPDALASTANYLRAYGWQPGLPALVAVRLPAGLDPLASRDDFADWRRRGVARANGGALPPAGTAVLVQPAGHAGPAFLATENFVVLKSYNASDVYAIAVALLADRIEGRPPLEASWPEERPLAKADRIALNRYLKGRGFRVPDVESRIDFDLRDAVRAVQAERGLPVDGQPTYGLLGALGIGRAGR